METNKNLLIFKNESSSRKWPNRGIQFRFELNDLEMNTVTQGRYWAIWRGTGAAGGGGSALGISHRNNPPPFFIIPQTKQWQFYTRKQSKLSQPKKSSHFQLILSPQSISHFLFFIFHIWSYPLSVFIFYSFKNHAIYWFFFYLIYDKTFSIYICISAS